MTDSPRHQTYAMLTATYAWGFDAAVLQRTAAKTLGGSGFPIPEANNLRLFDNWLNAGYGKQHDIGLYHCNRSSKDPSLH